MSIVKPSVKVQVVLQVLSSSSMLLFSDFLDDFPVNWHFQQICRPAVCKKLLAMKGVFIIVCYILPEVVLCGCAAICYHKSFFLVTWKRSGLFQLAA